MCVMCVCICVCAHACACVRVCVCVCMRARVCFIPDEHQFEGRPGMVPFKVLSQTEHPGQEEVATHNYYLHLG